MNCRRCEVEMRPGVAIAQTFTGIGDFRDGDEVVTLSPGGPGQLVSVMKCPACGRSFEAVEGQRRDQ